MMDSKEFTQKFYTALSSDSAKCRIERYLPSQVNIHSVEHDNGIRVWLRLTNGQSFVLTISEADEK